MLLLLYINFDSGRLCLDSAIHTKSRRYCNLAVSNHVLLVMPFNHLDILVISLLYYIPNNIKPLKIVQTNLVLILFFRI